MNKSNLFKLAKVFSLIILHAIVFLIAFFLTMRVMIHTDQFPTPDLLGKNLDECYQIVSRNGLLLKKELVSQAGSYKPYTVLSQQPPPGTSIKEGATIFVTYAAAQNLVKVPGLIGKNLKEAEQELQKLKLRAGQISYLSSFEPFNTVIAQSVEQEELLPEKSVVDLLLSAGQRIRSYLMPDFIGKKASKVLLLLEKASIKVGELEEVTYYGLEPGIIIKQFPYPGQELNSKSIVRFQVSK